MACARLLLLLWAAAPLAARSEATFTLKAEDTACRASLNEADDCAESDTVNCAQNYDVITSVDLDQCKAVCGYLVKYCYGIEHKDGRCEIWKVPILRTVESTGRGCYDHDNQSAAGEDEQLSLVFHVELAGADAEAFNQLLTNETYMPWKTDLAMKISADLLAFYGGKDTWSVTADDIQVMMMEEPADPPTIKVTVTPSTPTDALKLYAYLRSGSDFNDGTEQGGRDAVKAALEAAMAKSTDAFDFLGGAVTVTLGDRMLEKAVMVPSPSPSPSSSPSPSPSPADTSADGAASTKCWSAAALFLTSWVASTWRGEAH